ncbi:MAG: FAD-dependent oxidoreductase, partial [Gammaproteobacteria bacterium]|nr:FAD-dependent oxidoreductase [Gammaproteobacteria bacterium]
MSSKKQSVIVIGAGIIGLATAYELIKRNMQVTVIEENEPGWAASHGNAGMIYPAAGEPMINPRHVMAGIGWWLTRGSESPFQFSALKLPELAGWGLRAMGACNNRNYERGKKAFQELGADNLKFYDDYKKDGVEYEEHPGGFLTAFTSKKAFANLSGAFGQDPSAEILSGDEARQREPFLSERVVGAVQMSEGFTSVHPRTVCSGLARRIKELGGEIKTGIRVTGATHEHNKISALQTNDGVDLEADHFVLAAGGWSGKLAKILGSSVPITGGKGYAITIKEPSVSPKQTIFLSEYEAVVIPFERAVRFTGFLEMSGVNMELRDRRFKALEQIVGRYAKQLPEGKEQERWTGMRACSPDG